MYLYHYAAKRHPVLKTPREQPDYPRDRIQVMDERLKTTHYPKSYADHISFFMEPAPLDILGTIFGPDHHTWFPGNVVYEHRIKIDTLGDAQFAVVESPIDVVFANIHVDYDLDVKWYYRATKLARVILRYEGNGVKDLERVCLRFQDTIREAYKKAAQRPYFDDIKHMYAADVPHLLLYPVAGTVVPDKVTKRMVGDAALEQFTTLPEYLNW